MKTSPSLTGDAPTADDDREILVSTRRQAALALAKLLARDLARAHHQQPADEETEIKE